MPNVFSKMDAVGSGYLYYVSLKGVTGAGHLNTEEVEQKLQVDPRKYPFAGWRRFWRQRRGNRKNYRRYRRWRCGRQRFDQ